MRRLVSGVDASGCEITAAARQMCNNWLLCVFMKSIVSDRPVAILFSFFAAVLNVSQRLHTLVIKFLGIAMRSSSHVACTSRVGAFVCVRVLFCFLHLNKFACLWLLSSLLYITAASRLELGMSTHPNQRPQVSREFCQDELSWAM